MGAFVFPDCVSVSAVTGCLFCGVRGVGVGAWPVAGQVREAGHEQPHLPALLLPGTTSYCGCPPSASSLPWAWPGRGANDLAGTSPHLDPLGQGRLTWAQAWVPDRWVLCSPPPPAKHLTREMAGVGWGGGWVLRPGRGPGRGRGAELGPPSSPRQ